MSDASRFLVAGVGGVGVLSDAWGWPQRHCLKQSTIPITYFPTHCIFDAFTGVILTIPTFQITFFISHSNPCSQQGVVSALFQNCVLRHWCVWRDVHVPRAGWNFVGEGGGEARASVAHKNYQFPHSPFALAMFHWMVFFFLFGGLGCFNSATGLGLNLEQKIRWYKLSQKNFFKHCFQFLPTRLLISYTHFLFNV